MKGTIRGEKIKATDAIKDYIETKMSRLDKYFKDKDVSANILIKLKGKKEAIEVTIPYDKYILRSEEVHDDLYAAIDFSLSPPIASAFPFRLISPVMATLDLIGTPVSSLTRAVVNASPAEGPSFGIAASGVCI